MSLHKKQGLSWHHYLFSPQLTWWLTLEDIFKQHVSVKYTLNIRVQYIIT